MSSLDIAINQEKLKRQVWGYKNIDLKDLLYHISKICIADKDLNIGDFDGFGICTRENPFSPEADENIPKGCRYTRLIQGMCFVSEKVALEVSENLCGRAYIFKNGDVVKFFGCGAEQQTKIRNIPTGLRIIYIGEAGVEIENNSN